MRKRNELALKAPRGKTAGNRLLLPMEGEFSKSQNSANKECAAPEVATSRPQMPREKAAGGGSRGRNHRQRTGTQGLGG